MKIVDCFERFAQDEALMGRKKVQTVIEQIGIDVTGGLMSFFKEGGDQSMAFSEDIYEQVFEELSQDGQEYVQFQNFLPFLEVFFVAR